MLRNQINLAIFVTLVLVKFSATCSDHEESGNRTGKTDEYTVWFSNTDKNNYNCSKKEKNHSAARMMRIHAPVFILCSQIISLASRLCVYDTD